MGNTYNKESNVRRIEMDFNQDNINQNKKPNKNSKPGFSLVVFTTLLTVFMVLAAYNFSVDATKKEITYGEFLEMVADGEVEEEIRLQLSQKKKKKKKDF